jgi:cyclopropane-fatty-acyl-phospholipid synthase
MTLSSNVDSLPLVSRGERRHPAAARFVLRLFERIHVGTLHVRLPDGETRTYGHADRHAPQGELVVANWKAFGDVLKRGDIGFGEGYMAGDWTTPDLMSLLSLMVANRDAFDAAIRGTWWGGVLYRIRDFAHRNSRAGSRRNIAAHYDLGNAFYALWLDASMTYSGALFGDGVAAADAVVEDDARDLARAQDAKYARVIDSLALSPGGRVLEVGCGWGGFALAATARDLRVHGLTLSREQHAWASSQLAQAGAGERATFALTDYRDAEGTYDGIVSIEMFEAVGESYWPAYFEAIRARLRPGARAVVQSIVIAERHFDAYRASSDFIRTHVFPGGMLPSVKAFETAAETAGLRVVDRFGFGQDYARTLAVWKGIFDARAEEVRALGFDERFIRMWDFYLAYCAAAFGHGNTDVVHFTLVSDERSP